LSRCEPGEADSWKVHAAVYALHDKPLPLAGAVVLDQGYIALLHAGRNHANTRVRRLVRRAVAGTEGGPMREVAAGGGQSGATAD